MKKIICLYGGPGAGKSTTCAKLFADVKIAGVDAEMNREYIKEWVWEKREVKPGDQTYLFAKSARKERNYMMSGVDLIITDSPLILTHFYGRKYDKYEQQYNTSLQMLKQHHAICKDLGYSVEHYVITRGGKYNPNGRYQTEDESKQFDLEITEMLNDLNIKYKIIDKGDTSIILKDLGVLKTDSI